MQSEYNKLKEFYEENEEFKEYVDKYAKSYHITLEVALSHKLVEEYAIYLRNK